MSKLSRRGFFRIAGGATAALAAAPAAIAEVSPPIDQSADAAAARNPAPSNAPPLFFRADEMRFIRAATERLIPADANGPGAIAAAVPEFIDRQLAGAWGAGERLYRSGPWHAGTPSQGYQLPYTPAELFRHALRGIAEDLQRRHSGAFEQLDGAAQDAYLARLQTGDFELNGVPARDFFSSLLALTIEGFFSDPIYGGNRDMAAWKMIGFPGAYGSFYDLVDQHGMLYTREPMSMGESGSGTIRLQPVHGTHRSGGGA
jgi:gluconate 2-dehydrogenase gamma chain